MTGGARRREDDLAVGALRRGLRTGAAAALAADFATDFDVDFDVLAQTFFICPGTSLAERASAIEKEGSVATLATVTRPSAREPLGGNDAIQRVDALAVADG